MAYYDQIYLKRLNQYGTTTQERIANQRELNFEHQLAESVYQVEFDYEEEQELGELCPYKQDKTQTLMHLLTRKRVKLTTGTILELMQGGESNHFMIYWLEDSATRGYNRYILLRMTHQLEWKLDDGTSHAVWAYFYGPGSAAIFDTVKSKSAAPLYMEAQTPYFFITGYDETIKRELYFSVSYRNNIEGYKVTGYDIVSTPGVEFITIQEQPIRDETPKPTPQPGEDPTPYYWLDGGDENGNT